MYQTSLTCRCISETLVHHHTVQHVCSHRGGVVDEKTRHRLGVLLKTQLLTPSVIFPCGHSCNEVVKFNLGLEILFHFTAFWIFVLLIYHIFFDNLIYHIIFNGSYSFN